MPLPATPSVHCYHLGFPLHQAGLIRHDGACKRSLSRRWRQQLACRARQKDSRPAVNAAQDAFQAAGELEQAGNTNRVIRCGFCYDSKFDNLTQLANHMVGKRHRNLFPHKDVILACPYCDKELSQAGLHEHLASQGCPNPGVVRIPASQIRKSRQKDLDKDPRFAPIIEEDIKQGILKIRPLHRGHTFETALVCSESFKNSAEPPRFDRMLSELRWHAAQYEADPGPIVRQAVDFSPCLEVQPPDVSDVLPAPEPVLGLTDLFKGPNLGDKREKQRLQIAQTWGVWIWLIAELVPRDEALLVPGQDSIVVGATALMFHDRLATLEKFMKMELSISPKNLDQNLFLSDLPPPDLDYKSAAFIWWTSVDPGYRRQGIAQELLRGCEAVGAAAGYWTYYIQADTEQQNHSSFLPFDSKSYNAAVNAYKKAGYQEYMPNSTWKPVTFWSQSAKLMYKTFRP